MPYDSSLDKAIFSESVEMETTKITVSVYSYNNGTPKLQISRENFDRDGNPTFAKLGRMTKDEIEKILPLISKAIGQL